MAKELRIRRGTTAQHSTFTGAPNEVTADTTKKTLVYHDGTTPGGVPMARENLSNVPAGTVSTAMLADGSVTGPKLASGAAAANLGFTPANSTATVNLAGDQTVGGTKTFTNGVRFNDGTTQTTAAAASARYRTVVLTSGTTYTRPAGVSALYVMVFGATGGMSGAGGAARGGCGGPGYSEIFYSSPASSYSYAIGAGGAAGSAGGTTTWGGVISVTGSGGIAGGGGAAGGVASGGTFNANGGAGGTGIISGGFAGGGGGGAGSRAGNGGNGGTGSGGSFSGGGGGTGGNNASGQTGGAAATSQAGGVISLPPSVTDVLFNAGSTGIAGGGNGAIGAAASFSLSGLFPGVGFFNSTYNSFGLRTNGTTNSALGGATTSTAGSAGYIYVIEVY